jgi:hypothetical protein
MMVRHCLTCQGHVSGTKHEQESGLEMPSNAAALLGVVSQLNQDVSETALRRKAVQVTAQLPQDTDEALKVLDLARKLLLEFVGR